MEMKKNQHTIDEALNDIFQRRNFDIRSYKMSELQRKIHHRMEILKIPGIMEYSEYIKANLEEYEVLFNAILVNKGQFFRDPEPWKFLEQIILPEIIRKNKDIRIWSAGCASGEEPYSLGILLAEILNTTISEYKITIYATDIDETVLKIARSGTYTFEQIYEVPKDIRDKYFIQNANVYNISSDIKRFIIFNRNNLLYDPPILNINLVLCRNVLIYYDKPLQAKIISKLQYALDDWGYLWLGKSETLGTGFDDLRPIGAKPKWKMLAKIPSYKEQKPPKTDETYIIQTSSKVDKNEVQERIIQNMKFGFIMLDERYCIIAFNKAINDLWGELSEESFGKYFFDIDISYSPIDLKSRIEQSLSTGKDVVIDKIEHWPSIDRKLYLKLEIIPTSSTVMILIHDVTRYYEMENEARIFMKISEKANDKLLFENSELKNSNKKLQNINEELQSRNEELEIINENLKAKSEEFNIWIADLDSQKEFYEMIFNSISLAIIVVNRDLIIETWKSSGTDNWIENEKEVLGISLLDLNIGIPFNQIEDQMKEVIETSRSTSNFLKCTDSQGKKTTLEISINPLISRKTEKVLRNQGLVLVINYPAFESVDSIS